MHGRPFYYANEQIFCESDYLVSPRLNFYILFNPIIVVLNAVRIYPVQIGLLMGVICAFYDSRPTGGQDNYEWVTFAGDLPIQLLL